MVRTSTEELVIWTGISLSLVLFVLLMSRSPVIAQAAHSPRPHADACRITARPDSLTTPSIHQGGADKPPCF